MKKKYEIPEDSFISIKIIYVWIFILIWITGSQTWVDYLSSFQKVKDLFNPIST